MGSTQTIHHSTPRTPDKKEVEQAVHTIAMFIQTHGLTIKNQLFQYARHTKYSAYVQGSRGAEYTIGVCPLATVIGGEEGMVVYRLARARRLISYFSLKGSEVVELEAR